MYQTLERTSNKSGLAIKLRRKSRSVLTVNKLKRADREYYHRFSVLLHGLLDTHLQESMTNTTSSMVILVSAMLVERMICKDITTNVVIAEPKLNLQLGHWFYTAAPTRILVFGACSYNTRSIAITAGLMLHCSLPPISPPHFVRVSSLKAGITYTFEWRKAQPLCSESQISCFKTIQSNFNWWGVQKANR